MPATSGTIQSWGECSTPSGGGGGPSSPIHYWSRSINIPFLVFSSSQIEYPCFSTLSRYSLLTFFHPLFSSPLFISSLLSRHRDHENCLIPPFFPSLSTLFPNLVSSDWELKVGETVYNPVYFRPLSLRLPPSRLSAALCPLNLFQSRYSPPPGGY